MPATCVSSHFGYIQLFATLWTLACQAPLSMEFFRQEFWSGLAMSSSRGIFPNEGLNCISYVSCIGRWVLYH